jgi:ribonuclease HI
VTVRSSSHTAPLVLWQTTPTRMFKVNWDAFVDKKNGRIGYGLIIRDFEGVVLAVRSTTKNFLVTSKVTKVLVALHVVETCKEMGFHDIILEGDALQIVNVIKAPGKIWSSFGHIVDGIKLELSQL